MLTALLITIAILLIALWISTMALWWHNEQGRTAPLEPRDVIKQVNKAVRLGRRSWYGTLRYGKRAASWSEKKAGTAFIAVFPKSRSAFANKDAMTGLEHGPSSYFLASLSAKPAKKPRVRTATRKKKPEEPDLSE